LGAYDEGIIGKAQISEVFNTLRGQNGGMSEPASIEILDEPLPPELFGVTESTDGELAPLRQMYEIQTRAGRKFRIMTHSGVSIIVSKDIRRSQNEALAILLDCYAKRRGL